MIREDEFLEKIIKNRVPHFNEEFPLILFWSQRSGCTSFVKWFFFQIGQLEQAISYNPWVHLYEDEVYKNKTNYKSDLITDILSSKKHTIKLVRNPYKRAVSSFLILATSKGNFFWEKEWERIREYFYENENEDKGISFKQFLIYIRDSNEIDPHFSSQYVEGEEHFVKEYVYLEKFEEEIMKIENKYNLKKSPLSLITKSTHHLSPSMTVKGCYSNKEITNETFWKERSFEFPTYESFYDKETTNLVNEIFEKDFEVYGYKML
ncbi:sulfotransferase family 2 domain-containing protein [Metabacillus idriensis]|uniref:sulfotransferase family 2 domain-containing protein n=1 Tax=Metabacillus idriensis TaxID=324768 RepID=UPI00174CD462|nr:sulfotransferase family 2 domain-containing protein [Metabacillus idriensis]